MSQDKISIPSKKIKFKRMLQDSKREQFSIFAAEKSGTKTMSFFCPSCTREHHHGLMEEFELGHRIAHCTQNSPLKDRGYYVFLKSPKVLEFLELT